MRFYVLSIVYYIRNIIIVWENSLGSNYQHLLVIVLSQLFYTFVDWKYGQLNVDVEISNNNICHLAFSVMAYQYGLVYDEKKEIAIADLNPEKITNSKSQMKKKLRDEDLPAN